MDGCVLLTSTPSCVVSPRGDPSGCALGIARRGETTHSGVDVNNTHPSMINPLIKGAGETVETLRVPTSPQGEHSLAESRHDHWWRLPDVYVGAKNSAGFPNTRWKNRTR